MLINDFFLFTMNDIVTNSKFLDSEMIVVVGSLVLGIDGEHVLDQLDNTVGVTDLVIVPGNELDEGVGESNTSLGIKDGGVGVAKEVGRDNLVLGVGQNSLQVVLGSGLEGSLDLVVGGRLGQTSSQVDNRDIGSGDTEGHTGQLAVQVRDDLADSLGSSGGGGDDVGTSATSTAPVLARGAVNSLLGGSGGVNSGHQSLSDSKVVVNDLGERGQAVGGARSVRHNIVLGLVSIQVDTADEHGGISRRSRDDDLLGTTLQVKGSLLDGGEDTSGLDNVGGTSLTPLDVLGLLPMMQNIEIER